MSLYVTIGSMVNDESNAEKDRIIADQQKVLEAQKAKYDKISEVNIAQMAEINRLKAQIAALQGS